MPYHTPLALRLNRFFALALFLAIFFAPEPVRAQGGPIIVRDTEIEETLKSWAEPVIRAAELDPDAVRIILVQDDAVNAFVAGGQNVFIYTGLLMRSDNASEIVGVIAHELGHIRGGHLVRTRGALESASYESLLGALLGVGAAVLTGEGGLAPAIFAGTQSAAQRRFLAFSRVQESSADQAALTYMEKAEVNPAGIVSFMHKLENQELLPASQQSEYVRTHPLSRNRADALEQGRSRSAWKDKIPPAAWAEQHRRILAKLRGFVAPETVAWTYDDRDDSVAAGYARTIAAYRRSHVDEALRGMDGLLAREPDNPYFLELKGQILLESGHVAAALPFYSKALESLPDAALIRTAYAHALIESAGTEAAPLTEAVRNLKRAARDEPRSPSIQRLLATAYGRLGREPEARLHLAEEALLKGEIAYARRQAEAALKDLEPGSNAWVRAQDILNAIEQGGQNE